jgi:trehalose 6-phosphate phosphatase
MVRAIPGARLEDKGVTLSLHYRVAADPRHARRSLLKAARALPGARLQEGKMVLNVLPRAGAGKGRALLALRSRLRARAVIFLGDDVTDEDAFRAARGRDGFLTLKVLSPESPRATRARFTLASQRRVAAFLREVDSLLRQRRRQHVRRGR